MSERHAKKIPRGQVPLLAPATQIYTQTNEKIRKKRRGGVYLPIVSSFFTSSFLFPLFPPRLRLPVMLMLHERKMRQETEKEGIYAQNASCLPLLLSPKAALPLASHFFFGFRRRFCSKLYNDGSALTPYPAQKETHDPSPAKNPKVPFSRGTRRRPLPNLHASWAGAGRERVVGADFFGGDMCARLSFPSPSYFAHLRWSVGILGGVGFRPAPPV